MCAKTDPAKHARKEARRQAAEAAAALLAADPLAPLRGRLAEIEEQIGRLTKMRDRGGDALAGRLIETLERERAEIMTKVGGA